mgnify:CR=1 FL=1
MEHINNSQGRIAAKPLTTPDKIVLWSAVHKIIETFEPAPENAQEVWLYLRSLQLAGWCWTPSLDGTEIHCMREGSGCAGGA